MAYAAVLDADVLHPYIVADLLARLAERRLFRPIWSDEIWAEVERSLVRRGLDVDRVRRRIRTMRDAFPEADTGGVDRFVRVVPEAVDAADRHVVAAALAGRADGIVTNNHFAADSLLALGLEAQDVDSFLLNQLTLDAQTVIDVLAEMGSQRTRPPRTRDELLGALMRNAPRFVAALRESPA